MNAATQGQRAPVRITKPERTPDGWWRARASVNGTTREFHDRYGSWQTERKRGEPIPRDARREARPEVAAALERVVRRLERRATRRPLQGGSR
jgi:hypothetical protein